MRRETIISVKELSNWQDQCLIFDCRFSLSVRPSGSGYGQQEFQRSHIPGAHYLDLDKDLSGPPGSMTGRHPLPDPEILLRTLHEAGLDTDQQVVVYDDAGGAIAARAWWLIRSLGHVAVAVLDGGFPAWQAAGLPLESGGAVIVSPEVTGESPHAAFAADAMVDVAAVAANLQEKRFTLVDARAAERYRGETEPIDPIAGHIPGALNRPLTDNLLNGHFKAAEQLRGEWLALIRNHKPEQIIHMCGSGVTACHNQLAMTIAGLHGSRVYSGSWSEWIRHADHPVATGAE